MPRSGVEEAIERRRRERELGGERLVQLRIDFELDGVTVLQVGGVWDRRLDDFDENIAPTERAVISMHAGQLRAVEWFADWLIAHIERRDTPPPFDPDDPAILEIDDDPAHAYSALFAGARRGGKTWIAVALCVAYAIQFPGSIVWLVSPADTKHDEIRRYVMGCVPAEWLDRETYADGWELCNGSRLMLKSGYDPDALKEGKADLVLLNEGQKIHERAFIVARGAIVDCAGCVIVCANPPSDAKDHQWVTDFASDAAKGTRAAVYLHFDSLKNPHIDRRSLLAMQHEADQRTVDIEVFGKFLGPADAVAYNWIRLENERAPGPTDVDVTESFMNTIEEGEGIHLVIGLDVQRVPHIGGPIFRFYGTPERDRVIAWIVGEVVLEGGDEVAWSEALYERGIDPEHTLIICDASGQWQRADRTVTGRQPDGHGRNTFDVLRAHGWNRIKPPDRRQDRNPHIVDRVRSFTSMISSKSGRRRLFADPDEAPNTVQAIREWRTVNGTASRTQHEAHLGDATSYPLFRFFPRILRSEGEESNPRRVKPGSSTETARATAPRPELRITPQLRGPSRMSRRGSRTRGL